MCCQEEIIDISRILRCYVICPHLTLADNRADCCVVILRGIFILFQKMFHHLPHTGTRCFFFLPIYRPIFAQHENGKWLPKSRKVYDLDENGERIRLPSGNRKSHKENKSYYRHFTVINFAKPY